MLRIITRSEVQQVRDQLASIFSLADHELHGRHVSDPSGGHDAILYWLHSYKFWGYFSQTLQVNKRRWFCWFGVKLGDGRESVTSSVEINLSVDPANKAVSGRALRDDEGDFYLAHKGMLGGGRGGQMSKSAFARNIRGFVREPIQSDKNREEWVFIIGKLGSPDFLLRLKKFVDECQRLREAARKRNRTGAPETQEAQSRESFTPENEEDGTGGGRPPHPVAIRRLHGRVVNALQRELGRSAVNGTRYAMRPDLYTLRPDGHIDTLFEIKASSDT